MANTASELSTEIRTPYFATSQSSKREVLFASCWVQFCQIILDYFDFSNTQAEMSSSGSSVFQSGTSPNTQGARVAY
jgi:hypothetical protein